MCIVDEHHQNKNLSFTVRPAHRRPLGHLLDHRDLHSWMVFLALRPSCGHNPYLVWTMKATKVIRLIFFVHFVGINEFHSVKFRQLIHHENSLIDLTWIHLPGGWKVKFMFISSNFVLFLRLFCDGRGTFYMVMICICVFVCVISIDSCIRL